MQYYDSFAKQVIFNNQFGNPIMGIPLQTCLQNETKTTGGNLGIEPTDELKRFDGLIIPAGLYVKLCRDVPSRTFKTTECKTITDELFDNLMTVVTKPLKYNQRRTVKRRVNK